MPRLSPKHTPASFGYQSQGEAVGDDQMQPVSVDIRLNEFAMSDALQQSRGEHLCGVLDSTSTGWVSTWMKGKQSLALCAKHADTACMVLLHHLHTDKCDIRPQHSKCSYAHGCLTFVLPKSRAGLHDATAASSPDMHETIHLSIQLGSLV